jgi:hypothetical protein
MFKYARVNINRSETAVHVIDVPPWEVPVLAAVHGDDRVTVIGETPVKKPFPPPEVEFDRLVLKYKADNETGMDYAAAVYGVGQRGIQTLAAEIDKARAAARLAPVQTPEYDAGDDPLKGLFDLPAEAQAVAINA